MYYNKLYYILLDGYHIFNSPFMLDEYRISNDNILNMPNIYQMMNF